MEHAADTMEKRDEAKLRARLIEEIRRAVAACMQCGTCSASCPNSEAMDMTPRRMWRLVASGAEDEVLASGNAYYCSSCYTCTLRCPRGLPLTRTMAALKRLWALEGRGDKRPVFYRTFADNIRRYGRIQETALMQGYFLAMRNPLLALSFAGTGLKMLRKGKLKRPDSTFKGRLEPLWKACLEMEGES